MNYIVLEGISLYLFLALVIFLVLISLVSLICAVLSDRRNFIIGNLLLRENNKVRNLIKKNFVLKLKCGEFNIDEE